MRVWNALFVSSLLAVLIGCGGGSKGSENNSSPVIEFEPASVVEKSNLSLVATTSAPAGSIVSYQWSQKSGIEVDISSPTSNTLSFVAPEVTKDEVLVFTLKVTDNQGGEATADLTITVTAITTDIQLSGKIDAGALSDASVLGRVASSHFSAKADSSGNFELQLTVDDSWMDEVVVVEAVSTDGKSKLESNLGSVGDLLSLAGETNALSVSELPQLTLSSLTTAKSVLLNQVTEDGVVDTKQELIFAEQRFNLNQLLEVALASELAQMVNLGELSVSVSAEFGSSYSLLSSDMLELFLLQAREANEMLYQDTETRLLDSLNREKTASIEAGVKYAFYDVSRKAEFNGGFVVFNSDGTGHWTHEEGSVDVTWQANGDYVDIQPQSRLNVRVSRRSGVFIFRYWQGARISVISSGEGYLQLEIIDKYFDDYEVGEDETLEERSFVKFLTDDALLSPEAVLEKNAEYSFATPWLYDESLNQYRFSAVYNPEQSVTAPKQVRDEYTFIYKISYEEAHWEIDGKLLSLVFNDGEKFEFRFVSSSGENSHISVISTLIKPDGEMDRTDTGEVFRISGEYSWLSQPFIDIYSWKDEDYVNYIWFELKENGEITRVIFRDTNNNAVVDTDELTEEKGQWVQESYTITAQWYITPEETFCEPEEGAGECELKYERKFQLLNVETVNQHTRPNVGYSYEVFQYVDGERSRYSASVYHKKLKVSSQRPFAIN